MNDISELKQYIGAIEKHVLNGVKIAVEETAESIWEDVVNNAPMDTGNYVSSIQKTEVKQEGNTISAEVFSDLTVDTKSGKKYVLASLLEHGTSPHAIPNAFNWGEIYGYDSDMYKRTLDPNWHPGTVSQPHWQPAYNRGKITYMNNLSKAIGGK